MTLPKKASRAIEVGGHPYRWMVRRRGSNVRLTVEDSKTKDVFQKDYPATTKDDYGDETHAPLTISAAKVKEFIQGLSKPGGP
jgi:hypothetical protein